MRKSIFLLALVVLMASACSAYGVTTTSATIQLYGQFNQFCAPIVPLDPDPRSLATGEGVFGGWLDGMMEGDYCTWLDPVSQSKISFPMDWENFPNILVGDGYVAWVNASTGTLARNVTFDGVDISDTDVWISLPGQSVGGSQGGWHWVGIPYPVGSQVSYADVLVTDGEVTYSIMDLWSDPNAPNWMNLTWFVDEAQSQSKIRVPDDGVYVLEGGKMYQIYTNVNNLALILPHP